jgi:hypothetical protein
MKIEINQNPEYFDHPLPGYKGNPLIESLYPPPLTDDELILRLAKRPEFSELDRELAKTFRMGMPHRLENQFFYPCKQHISLYIHIYNHITTGYLPRNPITPVGQAHLYGTGTPRYGKDVSGDGSSPITLLVGLTGVGKSALVRRILNAIGHPVVMHSNYLGRPFCETQILYLKRNVPDQASSKSLNSALCQHARELIGNYRRTSASEYSRTYRPEYFENLRAAVDNFHVGITVIDELHHISLAKSGGADELLALIKNAGEEISAPLLLIGTTKTLKLLRGSMEVMRRLINEGLRKIDRPLSAADEDWVNMVTKAWEYQWVRRPIPISEEIISCLYQCTQGITGLFLSLFIAAQKIAIEDDIEVVDTKLLYQIYNTRFDVLHPFIDALKVNDEEALMAFDDTYEKFKGGKPQSKSRSSRDNYFDSNELQQELFTQDAGFAKPPPSRNKRSSDEMLALLKNNKATPCTDMKGIFGRTSMWEDE